jgi:phytoene synthase
MSINQQDLQHCRQIFKEHSSTYFFTTKFFDKEVREATYVMYAFFRVPDEIVDNPEHQDVENIRKELEQFKQNWRKAYAGAEVDSSVLRATSDVFKKYNIPFEYSQAFLKAMIKDTKKSSYKNYRELKEYMYGSAAAVGLIMSYIIGFSKKSALKYAKKLGYAMQLTNFLRDIQEDYQQRDRIYLPQAELKNHGLDEQDIAQQKVNDNFREFMKFQIDRTRKLYEDSKKGIPMLDPPGRYPVKLALVLYSKYLDKIEQNNYDVYDSDLSLSWWGKIKSVYQAYKL